MTIWALSDPHLSFGVPSKNMDVFGPLWTGYAEKMEEKWRALVSNKDLVLVPGDISWAMTLDEAKADLEWIHNLPGEKVILRGNHDYWWPSSKKLSAALPPSIHFIHNNAYNWQDVTIGGSRLWDTDEYSFNEYIHFQNNPRANPKAHTEKSEKALQAEENDAKIFKRELERLTLSLKQLRSDAKIRIALTHYPPISADLRPSLASQILEEYNIQICVFGHLHSLKKDKPLFGEARGVRYVLTSCDYLDFTPLRIL